MLAENETSGINPATMEFLENLTDQQLDRLLSSSQFSGDVLRYASASEVLAERIQRILLADEASPTDEHGRWEEIKSEFVQRLANIERSKQIAKPGDVLRFRDISSARNVKGFHVRLRKDPNISQRVPVIWQELPAAASSSLALLPELETVTLGDLVFQLEQGSIDLTSHETTLRLRLLEGPRYPSPELEVFLITDDGRLIPSEEMPE